MSLQGNRSSYFTGAISCTSTDEQSDAIKWEFAGNQVFPIGAIGKYVFLVEHIRATTVATRCELVQCLVPVYAEETSNCLIIL